MIESIKGSKILFTENIESFIGYNVLYPVFQIYFVQTYFYLKYVNGHAAIVHMHT